MTSAETTLPSRTKRVANPRVPGLLEIAWQVQKKGALEFFMDQWRIAIIAARAALVIAVSLTCIPRGTHADAQAESTGKPGGEAVVHPGDGVIGEWWTENRVGRIRFERHADGTYRGITTWRIPNAPPKDNPPTDLYNPNPKLRGRPTLGIVLVSDLKYEGGRYVDGRVYNPRDGDTYGFKAQLLDKDTLKIRGFMGISLFGWNQIWKRYLPGATP